LPNPAVLEIKAAPAAPHPALPAPGSALGGPPGTSAPSTTDIADQVEELRRLPLKIGQLPPDVQIIIRDYLATVGLALIIHWRVSDSQKHD
jgi:hypothetical protein